MERNNFLPHVALALVLILVAAFAGQVRRWQIQWKSHARFMPVAEEHRPTSTADKIAITDIQHLGSPEILVKFNPGVSNRTIEDLPSNLHDRIEDRIENAPGWEAIDDLDDRSPAELVAQYSQLPEV